MLIKILNTAENLLSHELKCVMSFDKHIYQDCIVFVMIHEHMISCNETGLSIRLLEIVM